MIAQVDVRHSNCPFTSVTRLRVGCSKRDSGIASRRGRGHNISLFWVQTCCGASYPIGTRGSSHGIQAAKACMWPTTSSQNAWNFTSTVTYLILACSLIKQTDSFTVTLTFSRLMICIYIYIYIYICRTAPLTSRRCILYIYSTNIRTEYFTHAAHTPFFFPLQNAVYFIMLPFLVPVLFTF
jgi:hypothetical protein